METVPTMEAMPTMVTVATMQKQCCMPKQHRTNILNEVVNVFFFLVMPFLENGATYLLSTVSMGMFVCLCVCGQLEFNFNTRWLKEFCSFPNQHQVATSFSLGLWTVTKFHVISNIHTHTLV